MNPNALESAVNNNGRPLLMSYDELCKTLLPYCAGKKPLIDMINDIWKSAVPQPNLINGKHVRMIFNNQFRDFAQLVLKENG